MNKIPDHFKPVRRWFVGLTAIATLLAASAVESANAAGSESRALRHFAGKYKGSMRNLLSREISTGNVLSFVKSAKTSVRIPKGKRGFTITMSTPNSIITEITLFGRITRASVKRGGGKVKYRGRFQGFTFKTTAGSSPVNAGGPFKAVARNQGRKEKLTSKIRMKEFSDPADPNRLTGSFSGKK